jgi:hypothetical protein
VLGPLTLARAYYHCAACNAGFCPRDHALGLVDTSVSPGVLRMVGRVGAMVSFEEGHALLRELAGVDVPTTQVERAAEALGREIAEDEQHVVDPPPASVPLPTLYLGMDGTGVPVRRAEVVDRPGKQPDGSAKTREVKLVTIWSAERRDPDGTPVRDEGSISYSAAIESAAQKDTDATPNASSRSHSYSMCLGCRTTFVMSNPAARRVLVAVATLGSMSNSASSIDLPVHSRARAEV